MSFDITTLLDAMPALAKASLINLQIAIVAMILAIVGGTTLTLLRTLQISALRFVIGIIISFIRGTPILIQIFLFYYGLPAIGLDLSPMTAGVAAIAFNSSIFITEIMRGGLNGMDPGPVESAIALGVGKTAIWTRIVLPQLYIRVLPPLINEMTIVVKGTALLSIITVVEVLRTAQQIGNAAFRPLEPILAAALILFLINFVISRAGRAIEQLFARGALLTVLVAAAALVIAALLAVPLALMALARQVWMRAISTVWLECFRNLPFIVVVYIFFYGLPTLQIRLPEFVLGIIALGCFASSYLSEIVRGAILSVPSGQLEAARAVGMSYARGMLEIVAPQTLKFLLPPATSTSISMIKETSILSIITVSELTYNGLIVQGNTFAPFEVFLTTAAIYWAITAAFAYVMRQLEQQVGARKGGPSTRTSLADAYLKIDR